MPSRFFLILDLLTLVIQWSWIILSGLFASLGFNYANDLHRTAVTVVAMVLGTIASYWVKKYLNQKKYTIMTTLKRLAIWLGSPGWKGIPKLFYVLLGIMLLAGIWQLLKWMF